MSNVDRPWGIAEEEHPERWNGAHATREEAVAEGRATYGGAFYVMQGRTPNVSDFMPTADDVIEMIGERASDAAGEVAEEFPDVGGPAREELDSLLTAWADTYLEANFWIADGEPERIEATKSQVKRLVAMRPES